MHTRSPIPSASVAAQSTSNHDGIARRPASPHAQGPGQRLTTPAANRHNPRPRWSPGGLRRPVRPSRNLPRLPKGRAIAIHQLMHLHVDIARPPDPMHFAGVLNRKKQACLRLIQTDTRELTLHRSGSETPRGRPITGHQPAAVVPKHITE